METNQNLIEVSSLEKEVTFKMSRSGGSGGQHVNKVATKATLFFNLQTTDIFEEKVKDRIIRKLKKRLTKEGILIIQSQKARSALKNKKEALKRLQVLLSEASQPVKKRKRSRTPAAVHRKRLDDKKRQSSKKSLRRKVDSSKTIDLFLFGLLPLKMLPNVPLSSYPL